MSESKLQSDINNDLRKLKIKFIHIEKSRYNRQTSHRKGIPDLLIFPANGMVYFVELKSETGKLSEEQIDWFLWSKENNYYFSIIRNWEQWELFKKVML